MKSFLKTTVAAVVLVVAGLGAANAEQVKVGIAAEPYPPFASPDASGKWQGWEIDIAMAMCEAAKLDCVITPVSWDGIIPALTTKKIDIIAASMSITAEREKTIDFSDKYYNTPTVDSRLQGREDGRDTRRSEGQDPWRAGFDRAPGLREEAFR